MQMIFAQSRNTERHGLGRRRARAWEKVPECPDAAPRRAAPLTLSPRIWIFSFVVPRYLLSFLPRRPCRDCSPIESTHRSSLFRQFLRSSFPAANDRESLGFPVFRKQRREPLRFATGSSKNKKVKKKRASSCSLTVQLSVFTRPVPER